MDKEIEKRRSLFDEYAHEEDGVEYWLARDLMKPLGYAEWRNFEKAVKRAEVSVDSTEIPVRNHFVKVNKMIQLGKGGQRRVDDYKLTRLACYLIAMNGDPSKPEVAFAQAYFAVKTREQELIERKVAEIQRIQARRALSETEKQLSAVVYEHGISDRGFRITSNPRATRRFRRTEHVSDEEKASGVPKSNPLQTCSPTLPINAKNLAASMTTYNVEERDIRGRRRHNQWSTSTTTAASGAR